MQVGSLPKHKFTGLAMKGDDATKLPVTAPIEQDLRYFLDVYVDDFISLAIATTQKQLEHVATTIMQGIHDVFPENMLSTRKIRYRVRRS